MWERDRLIDIFHQYHQMIIQPYEEGESSDEEGESSDEEGESSDEEGESDEDNSDYSDNED